MSCAICHLRKEKRFCLALHDRICPQCCGEQREMTLDCPSECPYLQQAYQHEKPRPFDEQADELFPKVQVREDFLQQHESLIAGLLQTLLRLAHTDRNLTDREVISALTTMARSYQTLVASGLVYQQPTANPAQAAIIETVGKAVEDFRRVEQQHLGYTALRDADVLRALVFIIRLVHLNTSGRPLARGFIYFLQQRFPAQGASQEAAAQTGGRIILP